MPVVEDNRLDALPLVGLAIADPPQVIIVVRQPSRFSVAPRMNIVEISAICPTLITGMIQLPGMPTPPAA